MRSKLSRFILVPVLVPVVAGFATAGCAEIDSSDDGVAQGAIADLRPVFAAGSGFARHVCSTSSAPGMAACTAVVRSTASGDVVPAITPSGYSPADLRSAYLIPNIGENATIAIVDAFDDPNAESDLATYRSQFGLPACTTANGCFRKVNQTGAASPLPVSDTGWAVEIALDLDMASAACPSCKILLVEANDNGLSNLAASVDTAVSLGAAVVSNSYGAGEFTSETSFDAHYHHAGVGMFASSGDGGFGVLYPAASPFVTAVGGTTLHASTTAARGWTETAWSGAGSGCSAFEPKPAWQHDSGCSRRTVADISAVADPATAVAVFDSFGAGGWIQVGGTSAAAPLSAGIYAATGRAAADGGFSYTAVAGLFNDVTSGSNGSCSPAYLCTGGAGFDGPTGNGTPSGAHLPSADLREQRIRGDFNGDGREDVIIVTAGGSFEYLGNAAGGFTPNAWVRTDLTLGNVAYVPGDFNGDGLTDVIIVTAGGSFEYLGNAAGGFTPNAWIRTDLLLGRVEYISGDFNGDGRDDLIIVTAGGSFEYAGLAAGGFTPNVWVRTDLTLGHVNYVAGDFNGDTRDDLIIVTAGGSFEYTGLAAGGFTPNVWVRADLPLGAVEYFPGDFNGDTRDDVIIVTAGGSFEYTGLAAGGFTPNVWVRADLPLGAVHYVAGDFNGDSRDDVVILTLGGSFEYTGLAAGGFTPNVWIRTDLVLHQTGYTAGDFNGGGASDLIITTAGGSFEYLGLGAGGFTPNAWVRTDLPVLTVAYF